jgi:hypothetical protein
MRWVLLALVIPVAACGSDSSGPGAGFGCLDQALPTTAPALVNVTGQVKANALNPNALAGVEIFAFRTSDTTTTLDRDTSSTPGFYSIAITTGGTPVDGYLRLRHSGQIDTYAYPSRPLAADLVTNVLMITTSEFGALASLVGVTPEAGKGLLGVIVKDCDGTPIAGGTVTTIPAGTVRYNAGSTPSSSATSTSSDGVAYVFNVTAGNVTVRANGGGHTLRQHIVNARADAVTLTEIQP